MGFRLDIEGFEDILPDDIDTCEPRIDLADCEWVYPEGALGVFLLLKYWIRRGKRPIVRRPRIYETDSYFERTGVPYNTYGAVDFDPSSGDLFRQNWYDRETMQEITPVTNQVDVAKIVEKFGGSLRKQYQEDKKVKALQSAMLETFQNMPDHAGLGKESFEGYANIQEYKYKHMSRVVVAAGDLGIGISSSLRTNKKYRNVAKSDLIALKLVVEDAASRFDDDVMNSRGGGLQRALENVRGVGGVAVLRSGTAAMVFKPNQTFAKEIPGLKFFPGTQITIRVSH